MHSCQPNRKSNTDTLHSIANLTLHAAGPADGVPNESSDTLIRNLSITGGLDLYGNLYATGLLRLRGGGNVGVW